MYDKYLPSAQILTYHLALVFVLSEAAKRIAQEAVDNSGLAVFRICFKWGSRSAGSALMGFHNLTGLPFLQATFVAFA